MATAGFVKVQVRTDISGFVALNSMAKNRQVMLKGVRAAAKIIQRAAKGMAPRDTGTLRKSLGIKAQRGRGALSFAVIGAMKSVDVFVKRKDRSKLRRAIPALYLHLVELGTRPHAVETPQQRESLVYGIHPGTKPHPFLGPAFQLRKAAAAEAANDAIGLEVRKIIAAGSAKAEAAARAKNTTQVTGGWG